MKCQEFMDLHDEWYRYKGWYRDYIEHGVVTYNMKNSEAFAYTALTEKHGAAKVEEFKKRLAAEQAT